MSNVTNLETPHQLVMFGVGETFFGIDIALVEEILPVLPITATPSAPTGVLGIVDVRKRVVPVFDLHSRFSVAAPASNSDARLILAGPRLLCRGPVFISATRTHPWPCNCSAATM